MEVGCTDRDSLSVCFGKKSATWCGSLTAVDAVLWMPKTSSSRVGVTQRVLLEDEGVSVLVWSWWGGAVHPGPLVGDGLGSVFGLVQVTVLTPDRVSALLMVSVAEISDWRDGLRKVTGEPLSQWS